MKFSLIPFLPLVVIAATIVMLVMVISVRRSHRLTFFLTLSGVAAALVVVVRLSSTALPLDGGVLFVVDGFGLFYSALMLAAGLAVTVMSYDYLAMRQERAEEFYVLLLGVLLGALVLAGSRHLVSFFLGIELLSISLYPLIAFQREEPNSGEAGLKYLILSGVSSAFLLFGLAIMYGLAGTMEFTGLGKALQGLPLGRPMMLTAIVLTVVGVGFKLGLVPFHMWTPDVYEAAPAPVTTLIATVSKGAVFLLIFRYFNDMDLSDHRLVFLFGVISIASMFVGNLLALFERNIKRLLAYSSIAHFGYLLVALPATGSFRVVAATYYLAAYFVMTIGAFGVVTLLSSKERDADRIDDYEGLFQRRPWLAGVFTLMLLSLAGMPLTAGFIAKVYVVAAGVESVLWLPVIALIVNSALGLFYYLRVISAMFRAPTPEALTTSSSALKGRLLLVVLVLLLVWWGVYPDHLIGLIELLALRQ